MTIPEPCPPQVSDKDIIDERWLLSKEDRELILEASQSDGIRSSMANGDINFDFNLKTKEISVAKYAMIRTPGKYKIIFTDEGNTYIGYKSLGRGSSSVAWLAQDIQSGHWVASKYYFGQHKKTLFYHRSIEPYMKEIRNRMLDYYYEKQKSVLEQLNLLLSTISPVNNKDGLHCCGLTMPFYAGKTIGQHMREEGLAFKNEISSQKTSLDDPRLLINKMHVAKRLFESVHAVHEKDILLIDSNPFNFIYNQQEDKVYPVDFNFAIIKETTGEYSAAPLIGEFDTMSPELIDQISIRNNYPVKTNLDLKKLMGFNHIYRFYKHTPISETYGFGVLLEQRLFFLDFTEQQNYDTILKALHQLMKAMTATNPSDRMGLPEAIHTLEKLISLAKETYKL